MDGKFSETLVLFIVLTFLTSLATMTIAQDNDKGRDRNMGYCFDAAFDPVQNRLFVVAGFVGLHVFEVNNGNLNFVTTVYDEGYYRNLKLSGNRAFIADADRGLIVFDISKQIPVLTWKWKDPATDTPGMGIFIEGNLAYLAVGVGGNQFNKPGLYIFDISNPDSPQLIGYCKTINAWDVWIKGNYAYVADLHRGLCVFDVSSASKPKEIARVTWDEKRASAEIVRGEGQFIYVAAGPTFGLVVIDIRNPTKPKVVGKFKSGTEGCGEGLCVKHGLVYLANGNQWYDEENGLFIIDVRQPELPVLKGKCLLRDWVEGVCLTNNYVYITNTYSGIKSIDVTDAENPRLVDHYGPILKTSIAKKLVHIIEEQGVAAAINKYRELRADSLNAYDFEEGELNRLGYFLLKKNKIDEAINIFKLNVEIYPESYNVYDSLGEAYMIKGESELAIKNYEKSLKLNPNNTNAKKMLEKIMKQ